MKVAAVHFSKEYKNSEITLFRGFLVSIFVEGLLLTINSGLADALESGCFHAEVRFDPLRPH